MMRLENLRGFHNQRQVRQSLLHQAFPGAGGGQQGGQRGAFRPNAAIGKEEEPRAIAATQRGSFTLSQTAARTRDSQGGRERKIDGLHGRRVRAESDAKLRGAQERARPGNGRGPAALRETSRAIRAEDRSADWSPARNAACSNPRAGGGSSERKAGGASSPMLQSASLPVSSGRNRILY